MKMTSELRLSHLDWIDTFANLPEQVTGRERREIIEELRSGMLPAAERLPAGQRVRIDRYFLRRALSCPASAAETPFVANAVITSRTLALRAMALRSESSDLSERIAIAIGRSIESFDWMADFLNGQDSGARSATVAQAMSWAGRAMAHVPWKAFGDVSFLPEAARHNPFGSKFHVTVNGRPDAVVTPAPESDDQVLISLGWPDVRVAGLDALVMTIDGWMPRRCVQVYPASGEVSAIDVTGDLLNSAVSDVTEALKRVLPPDHSRSPLAVPGQSCWHCDHRDRCAEGAEWIALQPQRRNGLLVEPISPRSRSEAN